MTPGSILIIIPCFNEEDSIEKLLKEIYGLELNYSIVVIDDGSTDNTYLKAIQLAPTIRLKKNLGIGGAVQAGLKYAEKNNFDFCVQIDGDGQHPPIEIKELQNSYYKSPCSMVIGSRYLQKDSYQSSFMRKLGGKIISKVLHFCYRNSIVTDPTSGMRLLDRRAIQLFAKTYPHDYPEPISVAWALRANLKVTECGVTMRPRISGQSSISGWQPFFYMLRVIGYIILTRLTISRP